jgi:hypothetical protein
MAKVLIGDIAGPAGPTGPPGESGVVETPWLVVDTSGDFPAVREGANGPVYRSAGWNIFAYYPAEGATFSIETARELFAQSPAGTLFRVWAFASDPSFYTWTTSITALQALVAAGKEYGHRFIFTLSTWGDVTEQYNQTGQPDITSNTKTVAWITSQQYLHSVYGANSLQDWVTLVVTTFADEPAVSIYDIMNEPVDTGTTHVTAWATYCSTVSGWIKAIAPNALVYMGTGSLGNFMGWSGISSFATALASMDLINFHDYSTAGFSPLFLYDGINKPQILDEYGVWAKGHYGAYGDSDVDPNGLPAMSWGNQARFYDLYLRRVFSSERTFAALAWSLTQQDSNGGPYAAYSGTGQFEPINQAPARKVIREIPVDDHPYFTPQTIGGYSSIMSWINSIQAYRYPDGSVIYSGANSLQQQVIDLASAGSLTGPSTSGTGPVARHSQVSIAGQRWPSLQFSGGQYFSGGSQWQDAGSATWFMLVCPTALPSSGSFAYLIAPTSNVAGAAVRINSSGQVQLEAFSGDSGGTVVATSTQVLKVGVPSLIMVNWHSGTSYRIDVDSVVDAGSSAQTYTACGKQFGAGYDAGSGFNGHLMELIGYNFALSEAQISTVNAHLESVYSGSRSALVVSAGAPGTVTSVSVATANGFAGTVATSTTTPAVTISTSVTGILKGNGTAVSAASSGTDYAPATSGSVLLKGNGSGGFSSAVSATDYAPATTGTSILKASSGGFANAVAGTDYAVATTGSSILKGNGAGGFSSATSGTDYAPATSGSAILKGNGSGGFSSAVSATDYAPATTGTSILKASSGGFANAVAGTDYAVATSGSAILKGNGAGGFSSAVSATDYAPATTGTSILKASSGGFANAVSGTDYAPATSGSSILKGNGSGGFSNAASGTDYAPATATTSLLKGNGSGGFSAAVSATDYAPATTGTSILKASSGGFAAATAGTDYVAPTGSGASLTGITASQVSAIALSLATALGDTIAASGSAAWAKVAGNTTATKKFYTQTGTGSVSAAPGWNTLASGDIPNNAANTTGTAANLTGGATVPAYLAPNVTALTDGASIALNAALGNDFTVTLGGNRTMAAPSNPINGQKITVEVTQDGTGSRTLAWTTGTGGYSFGSGSAPTLSTAANAVDLLAFRYSAKAGGATGRWCYMGFLGGF